MSDISFDLSGKIDSDTVNVLRAIKNVADSLSIPFFVVGATARDIILQHCYNVTPRRVSLDVDIGVEVANWDQFDQLFKMLLSSDSFSDSIEKQRLYFDNRPIDIVPFGPITDKDKRVIWPPVHERYMSMLGFEEAYKYSTTIRLSNDPLLEIKLPTLPGIVIMKLISWDEKYPERSKDAEDILFIMDHYYRAGNENRLYELYTYLLDESSFDIKEAGIQLLGMDMAQIADPDTLDKVNEILSRETGEQSKYRLVQDMIRGSLEVASKFDEVLNIVEKLKLGISKTE